MKNLTAMDVKKLMQERSPEARRLLVSKITADFRESQYTASEAAIASDIFRILVKDAETKIRQSLAEELAHCPNAPHDVVMALANDESEIATPMLVHSQVLTEDDLISIVQSTFEVSKLCAIANRQSISEDLTGELLLTSNTMVLHCLFRNKGASLNERQLMKTWDKIMNSGSLMETLVHRGGLPLTIVDKLFLAVSDELKASMREQYKSLAPQINRSIDEAHEWELLGLTPSQANMEDDELVEDLVYELEGKGRLSHSLLMRALCVGNLKVFETGIARLAGVPRINARILMMESSGRGLQAIYEAAKMPEGFYEAVQTLLRISLEETDFGQIRRPDFRKRVIDRIYIEKYNRTIENMEYMLSIIGGKTFATAQAS